MMMGPVGGGSALNGEQRMH